MSKFYYQLKGKLDENKEDWYYLCNDAEQALFKVKEQCKDESAIKSLERMIIDLNSIRMEQYERLTEYSLVEEVVAATNLDLDDMPNELRKHFKNVDNKDYIKKSLKMHLDKGLINKDEYNTLSKEYKLNEEFWNEAGEKEYKGIKISIEKGDHGNTCYIPLRNKELNFIPEDRTQFFSWKEVKEYIDSKLKDNNGKKLNESNIGYDYWGSKEMEPFDGPAYIQYYGGPGNLEYLVIGEDDEYIWVDSSNPGEPEIFANYDEALKVQKEVGGEIMSYKRDWLGESFEGKFEGKKIKTDLHNDKSNPVWIVGDISIDNKTYRVNAKVFLEDSEFGIENGPVSKLWIADSNGDCVINYDRGWDVKPTAETEEIYNIALGAVRSFRNDNPYEPDPEPEENINEAVDPNEEIVNKAINYIENEYNEIGTDDRYFLLSKLKGRGNAINKIKKALNYMNNEYNELGSDDRYFLTNILSAAKIEEPKEKVKEEPKERAPRPTSKKAQVLETFNNCLNGISVYSGNGGGGSAIRFVADNAKVGIKAQMQSKNLEGDKFALSFNNTTAARFLDKLEPLYSLAEDKYDVNLGASFNGDFQFYVYDMSQIEEMSKVIESILLPEGIKESDSNSEAYVICYGDLEIWPNRDSARNFYEEGIAFSEGAEQQRYGNIAFSLYKGNNFGDDGVEEEQVKRIIKRDENGNKISEEECEPMSHSEAFEFISKKGLNEAIEDTYNSLPDNLKKYLDNTDDVPTKEIEGTKWFDISDDERNQLKDFVDTVDSIPEEEWRKWDEKKALDYSNYANNADRIYRNSTQAMKESVEDKEDWSDPNYKVDTSNLYLTNYGYHNNSDIIYGRIHLLPKDKNSKLMPGHYDVIYYCENGEFQLFELGTVVRAAVDYLYNYGSDEYDWVKWGGRRIQLDNIYEILTEEALKNVPQEQRDAIEKAINNAYYNEEPFPLNKVKYD